MAHRAVVLAALVACAEPAAEPPKTSDLARPSKIAAWSTEEGSWGKFHSKRFFVSVPLPEGKTWKIDDRSKAALFAIHEPTSSRLHVEATAEDELMNRHKCEERARQRGWVPNGALTTVEDHVVTGPDAYDSRVWVALDVGKKGTNAGLEGHVFLFGAFLRRCLLVHLSTSVPSVSDEETLSARLAIAESRIVRGITVDRPRTTDEATVPRDKPTIPR